MFPPPQYYHGAGGGGATAPLPSPTRIDTSAIAGVNAKFGRPYHKLRSLRFDQEDNLVHTPSSINLFGGGAKRYVPPPQYYHGGGGGGATAPLPSPARIDTSAIAGVNAKFGRPYHKLRSLRFDQEDNLVHTPSCKAHSINFISK